jgi:hypothetical protein
VVRCECSPHSRPSRWAQIRHAQIDGHIDALVALAMALSLALLRSAKLIYVEALIG